MEGRARRSERKARLGTALSLLLGLAVLPAGPAAAQTIATKPGETETGELGTLDKRRLDTEAELASLKDTISLTGEKKAALESEVSTLEDDAAAINRQLIDTSARSRTIEERIERAAKRLEELRGDEAVARQSLLGRRALLIEVIAALQRIGYRPPPALLVTPENALKSVRSAILLGAVLPEVRAETEVLATELRDLVRIREDIAASREGLLADMASLAEEEQRLNLLFEEKKKLGSAKRAELVRQTALAAELAGRATSLQSLIDQLNQDIGAVREAQAAASRAEAERREKEEQRISRAKEAAGDDSFADTSRIAPALPFEEARGLLPRPVAGVVLAAFDQRNRLGETSRGQSIATRSGSRVVSNPELRNQVAGYESMARALS